MGAWSPDSKTHVATMGADDFRSNEQSVTFAAADDLRVELVARDGTVTVLKESIPVLAGEIVDATFMSARRSTRSSPSRWPTPRRATCCSRSTSRPR